LKLIEIIFSFGISSSLTIISSRAEIIQKGLSISEILLFFVKYRLQLRVFDSFYKLVYQYDPPIRNHHNKVLYCMMKDDHIYTLNHNINKLNQRLANNRPDNDNTKNLNQQIVNHILNKDIIGKTTNQKHGDLIDLINEGEQHHSYIAEALNGIQDQIDDVADDHIGDIVIKPSSNYRVDEDGDPNYYK
jgi:hypothetical protein